MRSLRLFLGLLILLEGAWLWNQELPQAPPPFAMPNSGSRALALNSSGSTLLVVNPDSNSVSLVDTESRMVVAEVLVGDDPRSVAAWTSVAYVANQGSDSISIIDLASAAILGTVPTGDRPVGVALSPDGRVLAVAALGEDAIRFLDAASWRTLSIQPVPDRPHGLSFTPDGHTLLVAHLLSGSVTILPVLPYVAFLPVFAAPSGSQAGSTPVVPGLQSLVTWPNVAPAPAVVVNASGTRAYLPQTMAHGQGLNTQFDTTVFPKVSVLDLENWSHRTDEHISLPEVDRPVGLPWDIAISPSAQELWVVNAGSNNLSTIDISAPAHPQRIANISVGANPRALVFSPDGMVVYVNNVLDGTVSVVDTSSYTVTETIRVTTIPLPPVLLEGKRLFHSSADPRLARASWISCTTCHVEGEQDGRTWVLQYLGDVPPGAAPVITRNTTSLLGMIETYPLRWSAEWDESADSEFSIRFEQYGKGLIDGDMYPTLGLPNQGRSSALDSLAAFIDSLQTPDSTGPRTPAVERGEMLFESPSTECLSCHPPPLYTDLLPHDVGTADALTEWFGPAIDTPTLRFLRDSSPYLHDGSAETLLDVLTTRNPGDRHGQTSHLSEAELIDLVRFLEALPLTGESS